MRTLIALISLAFSLVASPVVANEWHGPGSTVKYGNTVANPDVTIRYVVFDPNGVVTLMVTRNDGRPHENVQVTIPRGEYRDIAVKRDCTGNACRAYILELGWDREFPDKSLRSRGWVLLNWTVRVVSAPSS